jgi:hypothetical protein
VQRLFLFLRCSENRKLAEKSGNEPMARRSGIGRKRELAITALLNAPTIAKAAESLGLHERTLRLWLANPEFVAAFRQAKRELMEAATLHLQRGMMDAVLKLRKLLGSRNEGVRLRAAVAILTLSNKAVEDDIIERLAAVEEKLRTRPERFATTNGYARKV